MEGSWSFEYALYPYVGSWSTHAAEIQQQAKSFNAGVWTMPATIQNGALDADWSFARLEPAGLVLSAIKRAEDGSGVILRWYNPLAHEVTADLTTALDFSRANLVTLNEDVRANVPGEEDAPTRHWRITTPAGGIQSVRLSNG
jgi:alpha-mannosidase